MLRKYLENLPNPTRLENLSSFYKYELWLEVGKYWLTITKKINNYLAISKKTITDYPYFIKKLCGITIKLVVSIENT